jgi:conjugal transfer mating pair stabilization protein TraG
MTKMLSVYVLGNGDLYAQYFNAIVTSFGNSGYSTLLRISLLIGGFSVLYSFVWKRSIADLIKWFGLIYICIYIFFLPKVDIEIIDTVNGNKPYAVDNVPLGLGILANVTTSVSYALTQLTEMNFTMPDDLRYHQSGMVFASEIVRAVSQFEITDARFDNNLQGFIHQCVFYDILLNKYSMDDLLQEKNIWALVSKNASPARGFIYTDADNRSEFQTCKQTVSLLTSDWVTAVDNAKSLYSKRLFNSAADPKEALKKSVDISYGYLTQLSGQADRIMQQSLMANAIQRGVIRMGATLNATAALQSYAFVRAQEQKRLTNQTVADMAAVWLPLIKNAIELITYGSFIFVILLVVLPFGITTLKSFLYTIVWVQLWPPLYAVLNLTVSFYAQSKSMAATAGGLSLQSMPGLLQINADMAGLAGYLSMSVPVLAGGLLWGMHHAFLQTSQYAGGVAQSTAATGAAEAVTGNMGFGNTNFGNQSSFNRSANHVDTSARVSTGSSLTQLSDGTQLSVMSNGDQVLNMGNTISNVGASVGFSKGFRTSYSENADKAMTSAESSNNAYHDATSAGMRNMYEIGNHLGSSTSSGDSWNVSTSAGTTKAFGEVKRITQDFADRHHISYNEAANVLSSVYADGKAGISGSFGYSAGSKEMGPSGRIEGSLSATAGISRTAGHNNSTDKGSLYSDAKDFLKDSHYSENVDVISRAAQDKSLRINNETGSRLADNMGSSFEHAEGYRHDMQSSLQQAESYRKQASRVEEDAVRIDTVGNNELTNWIANQPGSDGKGKLGLDSVRHIMKDPVLRDHYLKDFAESYKANLEKDWNHGLSNSEHAVQNSYRNNNKHIPDASKIISTNHADHAQMEERARISGLTPNHFIDDSIKPKTESMINNSSADVTKKNREINKIGSEIVHGIEHEKSNKNHGSLLGDMWNNIDTKTNT